MGGRSSSPLDKRQQQHLRGEQVWGGVGMGRGASGLSDKQDALLM